MPKCQKVLNHSKMPLCGPEAKLNIAGDLLFWLVIQYQGRARRAALRVICGTDEVY